MIKMSDIRKVSMIKMSDIRTVLYIIKTVSV